MKSKLLILFLGLLVLGCHQDDNGLVEEVVVIGGGLMGSSTAWHLSNQDQPVLLIEKQDAVYTQGSSYGEARIARSNNRGNDIWSYLHNRSLKEVQVLIDYLNTTEEEGGYKMEDVYTTSPVTYVGRIGIYDRLLASLERQKVTYEMAISPEEGRDKFDVILPDSVLIQREYNRHSGMINPKVLIAYLHKAVRKKGNRVWYNRKVTNLKFNPELGLFEMTLINKETGTKKDIKCKKVVCAAGPYTGTLLKDIAPYFQELIDPKRVFLAFFKIKKEAYERLTKEEKDKLAAFYPVINSSTGTRQGSFFSMIEYYDEENHPVIKIGGHFQRTTIEDLDQIWEEDLTTEEIEWSQNSTLRYFNLLKLPLGKEDLELVDDYSCVYSLTETEVPFVTPIIKDKNLPNHDFVVLGGMSGVGGKGAMTYGLIGANLITSTEVNDSLYQQVTTALGFERLLSEVRVEK